MPKELAPEYVFVGVQLGELTVTIQPKTCPKSRMHCTGSAVETCQHFAGYGSGVIYCHFPVSADIDSPYCENVLELADALYGHAAPNQQGATYMIQAVLNELPDDAPDLSNPVFFKFQVSEPSTIELVSSTPDGLSAKWKLRFPVTVAEFWHAAEKVAAKVT